MTKNVANSSAQNNGQALPSLKEVLDFWEQAGPKKWFAKDDAFDAEFKTRFEAAHLAAANGLLDEWRLTPEGVLALLILLDQFPRNSYRNSPRMFATDPLALSIAKEAVDSGKDMKVDLLYRPFIYLPFEHSESLDEQERCMKLMAHLGAETVRYAVLHRDIIARFGRFPHRNAVLGRESTAEEKEFLAQGGFAG